MAPNDVRDRSTVIHREIVQLVILLLIAVFAFLVTRAVAASNHAMTLRDGEEWFARGQAFIARGDIDSATEALRHAITRDRGDRRYALALAHALALRQDYDGARAVLLTLRESAPEDPEINLQLARLATERQDVTDALRFYRNALYAPWRLDQADARRGVRLELVRFLLAHDQPARAQAELLALATDLPDDVGTRLEVAKLFAVAGDHAHALEQFQRVLRLSPDNGAAFSGAGQAAFQLANYGLAQQYLRQAPAATGDGNTREVVGLVLSNDPLASRLGSAERQRRLTADLSYAHERLQTCLEGAGAPPNDQGAALAGELDGVQIQPVKTLEQDTIESGMDLIARIVHHAIDRCGPSTALDQALLLIARQHGADAR